MKRRHLAKAFLASAAALVLAACASGARKPDLSLPAAYEAPPGTAALAPAQLDTWWTIFGDPQLNALEDEALRLSPDARTQIARLTEAGATRDSDILQTFPTGNVTGAANRKYTSNLASKSTSLIPVGGQSESETLNFNVSWELDFLGGLATARKVAKSDFAATRFDIEAARASLVANVADEYFQARGLAIQLADARESVRIETDLLRIANDKAARGLGAASDADRIAGDLAQAQSQAQSLEAELHVAQRLLLILVGRPIEPVANLPLAAEVPDPPPVPQAAPGELLERRPDVREADWRMRASALRTKLAKEQVFPNIVLEPAAGLSRQVAPGVSFIPPATLLPQQQTTTTGFWSYGVGLTMPLLDIPRLLQDAKAQGARTEEAVIAYEKAVQTAYGDAESALVRLSADERRIKLLEDGEARARRAYEAGRIRYAAGLDDLTTALTTEQAWRNDRAALTAERVQALRRAVQTYKALGGGWAYAATQTAARTQ
ncbi:MAG: efflux transporter outer membrane subunit [Caulobacterales bacterium]